MLLLAPWGQRLCWQRVQLLAAGGQGRTEEEQWMAWWLLLVVMVLLPPALMAKWQVEPLQQADFSLAKLDLAFQCQQLVVRALAFVIYQQVVRWVL